MKKFSTMKYYKNPKPNVSFIFTVIYNSNSKVIHDDLVQKVTMKWYNNL